MQIDHCQKVRGCARPLFLLLLAFRESVPWEIRRDSRVVVISALHKQHDALGDFMRDVLVLIRVYTFEIVCLLACLSISSLIFVPA